MDAGRALHRRSPGSADCVLIIPRCWEEGRFYDTWDYRAKILGGVTICCSGQGMERKAGLRSAATLMGADWVDELDKNHCSVLIVTGQSLKAEYARRHGIPVCAEQWLWDSIRAGGALDLCQVRAWFASDWLLLLCAVRDAFPQMPCQQSCMGQTPLPLSLCRDRGL